MSAKEKAVMYLAWGISAAIILAIIYSLVG